MAETCPTIIIKALCNNLPLNFQAQESQESDLTEDMQQEYIRGINRGGYRELDTVSDDSAENRYKQNRTKQLPEYIYFQDQWVAIPRT